MISQLDLLSILMVPVVAYLAGAIILTLVETRYNALNIGNTSQQDGQ